MDTFILCNCFLPAATSFTLRISKSIRKNNGIIRKGCVAPTLLLKTASLSIRKTMWKASTGKVKVWSSPLFRKNRKKNTLLKHFVKSQMLELIIKSCYWTIRYSFPNFFAVFKMIKKPLQPRGPKTNRKCSVRAVVLTSPSFAL